MLRPALFSIMSLVAVSAMALPAAAGTVTITAKNWAFSPSVVHLKKGQPVHFDLRSTQGVHGLNVPAVGLNNVTMTAKETDVTATPKKAGTFVGQCAVFCGAGHAKMKMTFIVK